jgi:HK97 gp10 family phage protein
VAQDEVVLGLKELKARLQALPGQFAGKIFPAATRKAAHAYRKEARRLCPVGKGFRVTATTKKRGTHTKTRHLRDTIRVLKSPWKIPGQINYVVSAGGMGVGYAHLVEFGTAPHVIRGVFGGVIALPFGIFATQINHPGSRPRPFMRPALDGATPIAIREAVKEINKQITALEGSWRTRGREWRW